MVDRLNNRRIFLTGAISGMISGLIAFIFARIMVEPIIQRAIDYESARDVVQDAVNKLDKAAGTPFVEPGPDVDIFSRAVQRNIGIATGMILMGLAFGLLIAAAYRIHLRRQHGDDALSARMRILVIGLLGWTAIYLVPFLKYPANPPAIGHYFSIHARGNLYLATVGLSVLFMVLAVLLYHRLVARLGTWNAVLVSGLAYLAVMCIVFALLPNLGSLAANVQGYGTQVTYGSGADTVTLPITTETPLAITDPKGTIVFPGFPADVLSRFRIYSVIAQGIIWCGASLIMGAALSRKPRADKQAVAAATTAPTPAAA